MSDMMCHIECRSREVLIRVPFEVAKKFAEVDTDFKTKFDIAKRRFGDELEGKNGET